MIHSPSSEEHISSRSTLSEAYEGYDYDRRDHTAKWNLILSCFFTIFVCAWIAIHPNTITVAKPPTPKYLHRLYTLWTLLYERLVLIFIFIIFPEFVLAWALVQRQVANYLSKNPTWTQIHGFLAIMGGFHYYKGANLDTPCGPVSPADLLSLERAAKIQLPTLEEIRDKSKSEGSGEVVTKTLALSQTFWFLTQCIAKAIRSQETGQGDVTKLELLTTAYIMMTIWMRWAWWNKPLNMTQSIRVSQSLKPIPQPTRRQRRKMVYKPPPSTLIRWYHQRYVKATEDMIFGFRGDYTYLPRGKTVPRFYTGGDNSYLDRPATYLFIVLLFSTVFAAINCIAWSYDNDSTLSSVEIVLWRLSSFAGVGFWLISAQCLIIIAVMDSLGWIQASSFFSSAHLVWMVSLWALVYVLLRVASFILAIRELNGGANLTLDAAGWTYFIPHV